MEHRDKKNGLFLLTIVAIVAIVAIVIMIASTSTRQYTGLDTIGQAAKVSSSKIAISPPPSNSFCVDSDGGKNYIVKGTVNYTTGNLVSTVTDYCGNDTTLREYYCQNTNMKSTYYSCAYGCDDGACNTQQQPVCGNGIIEPGEQCDGNDFGGLTCQDFGFFSGFLTCTSSCQIDTSHCNHVGNLFIMSIPSNATAYVDDIYVGFTPKMIYNIQEGNHSVMLTKPGYDNYTAIVIIYSGQTTNLTAYLTPIGNFSRLE